MLQELLKRRTLLFGAVMALCAFAMPSPASAASWSPVGTTGVLDSNNLSVVMPALNSGLVCTDARLHTFVDNAQVMTIVSGQFLGCEGTVGTAAGCTLTLTGTGFPWRATALSTTDIRIHGINIDLRFETRPPAGAFPCANNGIDLRLTGTLGIGTAGQTTWLPATRSVEFANTTGLTAHIGATTVGAVLNGTLRATGLLNILD
jgi:hypothetical protein